MKLENRHCTLCGPEAKKSNLFKANFNSSDLNGEVFSARNLSKKVHFRMMECDQCGILFSDPALTQEGLSQIYQQTSVNYESLERQIFDSYVPILDRAQQRLGRRQRFVEIGGGTGFMLKYAMERGFEEQIEIEPSLDAKQKMDTKVSTARFISQAFEGNVIEENSADLVCFFQMLDHVSDPFRFLSDVYRTLNKGGVSVCVVHNTRALSARIFGKRSPIFGLWHTYLFHPENLKRLFQKSGFENIEAFAIPNNYALWYWLEGLPLNRSLKLKLQQLLRLCKISNKRLNLYAGNFAVIASRSGETP